MSQTNIHLINPARSIQKNNHFSTGETDNAEVFFNFGLFAINQFLSANNISTKIHDLQKCYFSNKIPSILYPDERNFCCISVISAFNGASTQKIINDIKSINPDNIVVLGGQHFVGHLKEYAFKAFPGTDIVICDEGEVATLLSIRQWKEHGSNFHKWDMDKIPTNVLIKIGNHIQKGKRCYEVFNLDLIKNYNFKDYPDFKSLFPSLEYSRGCPYHCTFCANTRHNRASYRVRKSDAIAESITQMLSQYEYKPLKFYMQASNFLISIKEAEKFCRALGSLANMIEWRTEMRVDSYKPSLLKLLFRSGLRIIDIGIDSASLGVLKLMKKTSNPKKYLDKANQMLTEAKAIGILCKINMLVHPGDTRVSLDETFQWLESNKHLIPAISCSPALVYPGSDLDVNFEFYEKEYGTRKVENSTLSNYGVFEIHPSSEITHEEAKNYSLKISRMINKKDSYAFTKTFGYHSPTITTNELITTLPDYYPNNKTPYSN